MNGNKNVLRQASSVSAFNSGLFILQDPSNHSEFDNFKVNLSKSPF